MRENEAIGDMSCDHRGCARCICAVSTAVERNEYFYDCYVYFAGICIWIFWVFWGGDFLHLGIDTVEPRYCITRVKILFFTGQDLNPYFLAVSVPMFNLEENIHPSLFSTLISIAFCKFSPKSRGGVCSFASRESAC